MELTKEFKESVIAALKEARNLYGGTDEAFAEQWGLNKSVWSRMKKGETEKIVSPEQWIEMGQELDVEGRGFEFEPIETEVFKAISNDVQSMKKIGQGMILVDDCGIGKTFTGKYLSKKMHNCFYIDLSQCEGKTLFVRALAKAIGVKNKDQVYKIIQRIKYTLKALNSPVIIIDEGGYAKKSIIQLLQQLWNATVGICGWYMMGADGLRKNIESGIKHDVPGYREFFNRYGNKYMKITPMGETARRTFYQKLITDVLTGNQVSLPLMQRIINKCISSLENNVGININERAGQKLKGNHIESNEQHIGGLRMAKMFLMLNAA